MIDQTFRQMRAAAGDASHGFAVRFVAHPDVVREEVETATATDVPVFIISIDTLRSDPFPYGYAKGRRPPRRIPPRRDSFPACVFHSAAHASIACVLFTGKLPYEHGVRNNLGYARRIAADHCEPAEGERL
jgi:hypothetical protein